MPKKTTVIYFIRKSHRYKDRIMVDSEVKTANKQLALWHHYVSQDEDFWDIDVSQQCFIAERKIRIKNTKLTTVLDYYINNYFLKPNSDFSNFITRFYPKGVPSLKIDLSSIVIIGDRDNQIDVYNGDRKVGVITLNKWKLKAYATSKKYAFNSTAKHK